MIIGVERKAMSNRLELSDDRMELRIHGPGGRLATLHSRLPAGFTDEQLEYARSYQFSPGLQKGQVNTARRFTIGRKAVYVHKGTGPPTWWLPRLRIRRDEVMVGWLQLMIAVVVKPNDDLM
jgi:hypothetical protein